MIQGLDVLPLLIQTVEKANNQPTQIQLVTEAVTAAVLLLKLSTCDIQAGMPSFYKRLRHNKTQNNLNLGLKIFERKNAIILYLYLTIEAKLGLFWNIILDGEKQLFTNDKFLSSASDDGLCITFGINHPFNFIVVV